MSLHHSISSATFVHRWWSVPVLSWLAASIFLADVKTYYEEPVALFQNVLTTVLWSTIVIVKAIFVVLHCFGTLSGLNWISAALLGLSDNFSVGSRMKRWLTVSGYG